MSLPFLFVIADSISMQYGPFLKQFLANQWIYARKGDFEREADFDANGRDSAAVLEYVRSLVEQQIFHANLLLINCGLHDIKRNLVTNSYQIPPDQYKNNLLELVKLSPRIADKMAWISTTPVDDEIHNSRSQGFYRYNADVELYNQAVIEVMQPAGIRIIDLYSFTRNLGEPDDLYEDHVHFREPIQSLQGAFIAGNLAQILYSMGY